MVNILIITCSYGNYKDSHTIRLRNMLYKLNKDKYRLTVLAPGPRQTTTVISEGVTEEFVSYPSLIYLIDKVFRIKVVGRILSWLLKNLFYRFGYPDLFMGWDVQAIKFIKSNSFKRPDIIISASGSPTAHLVAFKLKSMYQLPWIADFGDPWYVVDKSIRPYYSMISKRLESKVLNNADFVSFTSYLTLREYQNIYGLFKAKSVVIPYGFVSEDLNLPSKPLIVDNRFILTHIGTAHKSDRNLLPIIRVLDSLNENQCDVQKLSFILAGSYSSDFEKALRKTCLSNKCLGPISLRESIEIMSNANVNIVVGNKNGSQIPGKVFMSLALPVPILYISQCQESKDEAMYYLKNTEGVIFCVNEDDSIRSALIILIRDFKDYQLKSQKRVISPLVTSFESQALALQMERIIDSI